MTSAGQAISAPPGVRVGVHQGAGAQLVLRGAALDEVRGQGERGAGEADERRRRRARATVRAHRLLDGGERVGVELRRATAVAGRHRPRCAPGRRTPGPAGHDVDVDAGELQRHDDVAEEDAASTPCRRTGCSVISLASSGSRQASSIAVPTRSCAVLRQRAAGLPHEPDRRGHLLPLALIGAEEAAERCVRPRADGSVEGVHASILQSAENRADGSAGPRIRA